MISVEDAKLILQDPQMTDQDIQETIDSLQLLVELMFDKMIAEKKAKKSVDEPKPVTPKEI